jgi:hypothetical protein
VTQKSVTASGHAFSQLNLTVSCSSKTASTKNSSLEALNPKTDQDQATHSSLYKAFQPP